MLCFGKGPVLVGYTDSLVVELLRGSTRISIDRVNAVNCGKEGHNAVTCAENSTDEERTYPNHIHGEAEAPEYLYSTSQGRRYSPKTSKKASEALMP